MDTIPPEIIGFNDTLIYSFAENCGSSLVQLPDVSASDCGVTSAISISYEIDFGSEGKIDRRGVGPNASGWKEAKRFTSSWYKYIAFKNACWYNGECSCKFAKQKK